MSFFGEKFVSFRSLMKRYMLANNYVPSQIAFDTGENGNLFAWSLTIPNFPYFPGFSPTTENWDSFTHSVNFAPPAQFLTNFRSGDDSSFANGQTLRFNTGNLTYFHYVTKMFVGWRGSLRSKYIVSGPSLQTSDGSGDTLRVRRLSTSNKTFGIDPPIGLQVSSIYPVSGGRWNQASAQVVISDPNAPGPPGGVLVLVLVSTLMVGKCWETSMHPTILILMPISNSLPSRSTTLCLLVHMLLLVTVSLL